MRLVEVVGYEADEARISYFYKWERFKYEAYIEDIGGEAWENEEFVKLANKYGFTKENLHKGLEHLGC